MSSGLSTLQFIDDVWELNRSLVTEGYDKALEELEQYVAGDLHTHTIPSGTEVWTWKVPRQWSVEKAYIADANTGERIIEYDHPLRLPAYSNPVNKVVDYQELFNHLHWDDSYSANGEKIPSHPDALPYIMSFYDDEWGFCIRETEIELFDGIDEFKVCIDASFEQGELKVGEVTVEGTGEETILFLAHLDHPAQVNDDLSGVAVGVEVMNEIFERDTKYNYTFLIVPETIGSISYLSQNEPRIDEFKYGVFLEMLGTGGEHALQYSHQEDTVMDRAAEHILSHKEKSYRTGAFRQVIGNDEMVTNGPGVQIPTISLSRWPYDEYHTSLDTPEIISEKQLSDSINIILNVVEILERNCVPVRKFKGPVFLSGEGLWDKWGGRGELREKIEYIMLCLEGNHTLLDISMKYSLPFKTVYEFITDLNERELVELREGSSDWN